jgi:mannose-6-phosphate isomerase
LGNCQENPRGDQKGGFIGHGSRLDRSAHNYAIVFMMNIQPFDVERPWGSFRQFTKNTPVTVKILSLKPHQQFSLQSHTKREEFWRILSGDGKSEINDTSRKIQTGEELVVPIGAKHRLSAGEEGLEVLEISLGDFDEEDISRYEDAYGRV